MKWPSHTGEITEPVHPRGRRDSQKVGQGYRSARDRIHTVVFPSKGYAHHPGLFALFVVALAVVYLVSRRRPARDV